MRRWILAAIFLFSATPTFALSEIGTLVQYDCEAGQTCNAQCTGPSVNLSFPNYRNLTVFQWKDHVRRLWIAVGNKHYVLGDDTNCTFEGKPTWKYETSPIPQPHPGCTCIGNVCTPPGCNTR